MKAVNFSNHRIEHWSEEQRLAFQKYGELVDLPFPQVNPSATKEEVEVLASECVKQILENHPEAVLCQGEFCLVYAIVTALKERGIHCLAACSERVSVEKTNEDGSITKEARFLFVQFREY